MARRTVDTKTVRDRLGDLLDQARYRGDEFVIQRRGRPVAALIPYDTFERFQRERREALRVFEQIWEANAGVDPRRVAEDVERAVGDVRKERLRPRRQRER